MKVRIKLIAKKELVGVVKEGEKITLYNDVFNEANGLAFYPIDKKQWSLESYNEFSGMYDRYNNEIYETDDVVCTLNYEDADGKEHIRAFGKIVFDEGAFCVDISKTDKHSGYDVGQKICIYSFATIEIINL